MEEKIKDLKFHFETLDIMCDLVPIDSLKRREIVDEMHTTYKCLVKLEKLNKTYYEEIIGNTRQFGIRGGITLAWLDRDNKPHIFKTNIPYGLLDHINAIQVWLALYGIDTRELFK